MTIQAAPHYPTTGELEANAQLAFMREDTYRELGLQAAGGKLAQGDSQAAFAMLKSLVLLWPDDSRFYEAFAMVYQSQGALKDARLCYEQALSLDAGSLRAHLNLGEMKWRIDQNAEAARNHLQQVVAHDPEGRFGARAALTLKRVS